VPTSFDVVAPPWAPFLDDGGEVGDVDRQIATMLSSLVGPGGERVDWEQVARVGQPPEETDRDAFDGFARELGIARFARRVLDGDPHAWIEALASYRARIRPPVPVAYRIAVEDDLSVRVAVELPPPDAVAARTRESVTQRRSRYEELCCAIVLAFAYDTFRILPPRADSVYVTGFRHEVDPATGHPRVAILLRLATDRASLDAIDLSSVTPSATFEYLGGASKRARAELVPLAFAATADQM
jgi:hypothetical protein